MYIYIQVIFYKKCVGKQYYSYFDNRFVANIFCFFLKIFGYSGQLYDDKACASNFEIKTW